MTSKKIIEHIDTGLYVKNTNNTIASAFDDIGGKGGRYVLNYHQGDMPAHKWQRYDTLDRLEIAMREFEPDLRKWHYAM